MEKYFRDLPPPARDLLLAMRELIHAAAPELNEDLKWGTPAYLHAEGVIMFVVAAYSAHANFVFTPSTREAFAADLTRFETGKGSIKLPYRSEIPADLLRRMIRFRIREYERGGVKWM